MGNRNLLRHGLTDLNEMHMNRKSARPRAKRMIGNVVRRFVTISLLLSLLQFAAARRNAAHDRRHTNLQNSIVATPQTEQEVRRLEPGKPIERELAEGQAHEYHVEVAAGEYLHVVTQARGTEVSILLRGSDGRALGWAQSTVGPRGLEEIWRVAEASETLRVIINGADRPDAAGRYEVRIEALRPATKQDRIRHHARQLLFEGWGLEMQEPKTAESLRNALELYEKSRSLFKSNGDQKWEAFVLNRLGVTSGFFLSDYASGLNYFQQSLAIRQSVGDLAGQAGSLLNIGFIYDYLNENQKVIDYYERALPLYRSLGIRLKEGAVLNNLSSLYMKLGEPEKALVYLERALLLFRSLHYSGDGVAMTLHNIGSAYHWMGEPEKALDYYNQSLANAREQNLVRVITAGLYVIGRTLNSLGRHHEAIEYFNQALSSQQTSGERADQALTLNGIGKTYIDARGYEKALDPLNRALSLWQAIGGRDGEAAALYQVARYHRAQGDLERARTQVETALEIIESIRTKIASQELRTSYLASVGDYYDFYTDLLMQLHKKSPLAGLAAAALQNNERARARSLLELLNESGVDIRQGVDPLLLKREGELQRALNAKAETQTRLLGSAHTKEQASAVTREIENLATEYQQVRAQIRLTSPRYAALTQPQPLSLKEIQQQVLDADTMLLEYALGDERSYLWAVTPTSCTSFELPGRAAIEIAARHVYDLLTARSRRLVGETTEKRRARIAQSDAKYRKAATALSQIVLGPVVSQLRKKRLLIVGDGALLYLPFAALPTPAANVNSGAQTPLIVEHEIVSVPSASTLAVLRHEVGGRRPAAKAVAVFADPVFDKDDERVQISISRNGSGSPANPTPQTVFSRDVVRAMEDVSEAESLLRLPRLHNTRWEADVINSLVSKKESMQALDFAANRATATSLELGQYRIVHFATHAFANNVHPELSGIVLSLVDEKGQPQDGFLRTNEIFNLKLPAELVVLSACRTGLGKEVKGEGLIGLTRGFMYAGTPRVVVSLWSLSDRPTAELMARFYKKMLGRGRLPPAAALRAAQLEMWEEKRWDHPYFWAGFVLQGEWR